MKIILVNVIVFFLQIATRPADGGITFWFFLDPQRPWEIWRLLTADFCHDPYNPFHLLFNMIMLYIWGRELEHLYGQREYLAFYLSAAVFSSVVFLIYSWLGQFTAPAVGASSAVLALMALYACLYPTRIVYLIIFPIEARWIVIIYCFLESYYVISSLSEGQLVDNVAHAGHLGGLAFGLLYYHYQWRCSPWIFDWFSWSGWTQRRRTPNHRQSSLRVYIEPRRSATTPTASAANTSAASLSQTETNELDQLLEKISQQGINSLTPTELTRLEEISRRKRETKR